jgi:hypothetical protein
VDYEDKFERRRTGRGVACSRLMAILRAATAVRAKPAAKARK